MSVMPGVKVATEVLDPTLTSPSHMDADGLGYGYETYSFTSQLSEKTKMDGLTAQLVKKAPPVPLIMHNPKTHVNSIYLNAYTQLSDPEYVNALCVFINSVPPNDSIDMYFGSAIDDCHTIGISSIIHAITNTKSHVRTLAYGMCSIPETMIWSYGKTREIGKYGVIQFGGGQWIRKMKEAFEPYIQTYLDHCKEIGILDDKLIEDIVVKQKSMMFMSGEDGKLVAL